ncbi:RecQ family ATP-dependent DNA helicase [Thermosipho atlanticus]|uniref:ATP-dependent DNA helicase RecQ n=1 Tax=Thermosipho atlanticus DSM 15807 TaxID=1123380 RepID=A0A1M5TME7_9BACT|nr:RecQ family ATP-dependent DNA helicase [Thermosipho atlanticus]SHH51841.1 ATP-dependent DNA helicase RecQ [Thermosipho atlanticus DSM 15807]
MTTDYEIFENSNLIEKNFKEFKFKEKLGRYNIFILAKYYPLNSFPDEILENDERILRQKIYKFKNGERETINSFAKVISNLLSKNIDKDTVFCVIPASTKKSNKIRYKKFSKLVSRKLGINNGYKFLRILKEKKPKHISGKEENILKYVKINSKKIKNKTVILFDDIITTGNSFQKIADTLIAYGAKDVIGVFLAQTIRNNEKVSSLTSYNCLFYPKFFDNILSKLDMNFFIGFSNFFIDDSFIFTPEEDNTPLILTAKIYNNILQRGVPTYSSLFFERKLSEKVNKTSIDRYITELKNLQVSKDNIFAISILSSWLHKILVKEIVYGGLNEKKEWRIAVIENDASFSKIAMEDFSLYMKNLSRLFDSTFPKINLTVFREEDVDLLENSELIEVQYKNLPEIESDEKFDLIIDFGMNVKRRQYNIKNNKYIKVFPLYYALSDNSKEFYDFEIQKYTINKEKENSLKFILENVFRKKDFREGQLELISNILGTKSVIGLFPTGSGKSLTYQLSALLQPGTIVIVDPIKSLMEDQVKKLKELGINSCAYINSDQKKENKELILKDLKFGRYKFLFISPERLQIKSFRKLLNEINLKLPFLVIDEAHCISEWGHDFRPSYLNVSKNLKQIVNDKNPKIIALTGTASYVVLKDIQEILNLKDNVSILTPKTFDRKELHMEVIKTFEKEQVLIDILYKRLPKLLNVENTFEVAGIIFSNTISGENGVYSIYKTLKNCGLKPGIYSGKKPKKLKTKDYNRYKQEIQSKFLNEEIQLLVATKAFGMGIDKSNIRYTIHYNLPSSIESFYQEAGRAGRDRKKSYSFLIFTEKNPALTDVILNTKISNKIALKIFENYKFINDDIFSQLHFHFNSFKGKSYEIAKTLNFYEKIKKYISTINEGSYKFIEVKSKENYFEKILYRLNVLGIIDNYTVEYKANEKIYELKISKKTQEDVAFNLNKFLFGVKKIENIDKRVRVEEAIKILIDYMYERVEKQRRKTLFNLVQLARNASSNEEVKRYILNYFNESIYTRKIIEIIQKKDERKLLSFIDEINEEASRKELEFLSSNIERLFENYPDNSYLYLIKALLGLKNQKEKIVINNLRIFSLYSNKLFVEKVLKKIQKIARNYCMDINEKKLKKSEFKKAKVILR